MTEKTNENFVRVRILQSLFEGQQLEAALKEAGIPSMVISYRDAALDGLYQFSKGFGELRVPEHQEALAKGLLAGMVPENRETPDEDLDREAMNAPASDPEIVPVPSSVKMMVGLLLVVAVLSVVYLLWTLFSFPLWIGMFIGGVGLIGYFLKRILPSKVSHPEKGTDRK
jgi:hypothetical protein